MNLVLKNIINEIYFENNHELYLSKCKDQMLLKTLYFSLSDSKFEIVEERNKNYPSKRWTVKYPEIIRGEFQAFFTTTLLVSKIAPFFYIQHDFEVESVDDRRMIVPTLNGYDAEPFIKEQMDFDEHITKILEKMDYQKLTFAEANEVISGLKFPKGVTIFGPQVTVEHALFIDILDLCED